MPRFSLDQISKMPAAVQAQVMAQMGPKTTLPVSSPAPEDETPTKPIKPAKNRIRQNSAGLNKTEQAFLEHLKSEYRYLTVLSQAVTLKLGNGVRFTVDFVCFTQRALPLDNSPAYQMDAYETKGYLRDDANVKLKVAASLYPWIKFHLVTRKNGEWQIQEVLP